MQRDVAILSPRFVERLQPVVAIRQQIHGVGAHVVGLAEHIERELPAVPRRRPECFAGLEFEHALLRDPAHARDAPIDDAREQEIRIRREPFAVVGVGRPLDVEKFPIRGAVADESRIDVDLLPPIDHHGGRVHVSAAHARFVGVERIVDEPAQAQHARRAAQFLLADPEPMIARVVHEIPLHDVAERARERYCSGSIVVITNVPARVVPGTHDTAQGVPRSISVRICASRSGSFTM